MFLRMSLNIGFKQLCEHQSPSSPSSTDAYPKQQPFDASVDDAQTSQTEIEDTNIAAVGRDLVVTEDDLLEARDTAASYSLEDVRRVIDPLLLD